MVPENPKETPEEEKEREEREDEYLSDLEDIMMRPMNLGC